ncbi:Ring finger domain family protein [Brugia pahangi]
MKEFDLKIANEEMQCAICLKILQLNEISALRCGHTFHYECILRKIQIKHKCPVCDEVAGASSIIQRIFLDIHEKNEKSSKMEDTSELVNEIRGNLSKVETELELIHFRMEHSSALLRVLSHMLSICVKALRM